MNDTDGALTGVTIEFAADDRWNSGTDASTGDGKLFAGYMDFFERRSLSGRYSSTTCPTAPMT